MPQVNHSICNAKYFIDNNIDMGKKLCSPSPRYMGVKELSKPRAANREKSIEDMDYEKNRQECTFKPKLIASKNYKSIQSHLSKASSSQ